jgi:hypothetical protein
MLGRMTRSARLRRQPTVDHRSDLERRPLQRVGRARNQELDQRRPCARLDQVELDLVAAVVDHRNASDHPVVRLDPPPFREREPAARSEPRADDLRDVDRRSRAPGGDRERLHSDRDDAAGGLLGRRATRERDRAGQDQECDSPHPATR